MLFDNALWKAAFTGITSNTNVAIMVPQIEVWFILKDNLGQITSPGSVLMSPFQTQPPMTKVLPIAWKKMYSHSPPCGAGVDRSTLTSPSVIHCRFFELFVARRSTSSKLPSLWNCSTARELLLRNRKILLLEGDDPPCSNSVSCGNFFLFRHGGTLRSH
ncbi:hypothetical protein TNCV_1844801 [Trichonephila clavipes]|nr:hypothetical protein TNCV_1844801 [Trichonephila clavipes]